MRWALLLLFLAPVGADAQPQPPRGNLRAAPDHEEQGAEPDRPPTASCVEATKTTEGRVMAGTAGIATPPDDGAKLRWHGHGFLTVTSRSGIVLAVNPFAEGVTLYEWPERLAADIVLISTEDPDSNASDRIIGNPQIFRSIAGVGANRANGIPFRGVATYRDAREGRDLGSNTAFLFEIDHVRFCHLGSLGHTLTDRQAGQFGRVDVLLLPVGYRQLTPREILHNATMLNAKWIIPIAYHTDRTPRLDLRPLDEANFGGLPVQRAAGPEFTFHPRHLPSTPTVLLLRQP